MSPKQLDQINGLFDPDLPTANAVLVSLSCVATRYAANPSEELALLGWRLACTLTAPEYAESHLVVSAAKQLMHEWQRLLGAHRQFALQQASSDFLEASTTIQ